VRKTRKLAMKLHINGEEKTIESTPPFTLSALVESLGMKADRVAIELNRDIVPRDRWAETTLNDGDKLEMVHFVGGGSQEYRSRRRNTIN
jgi:thiamine biosynthesis protein ThiS